MYLKRRPTGLSKPNRIPEVDAARGICVAGMILVHFIYDLTEIYRLPVLKDPRLFLLVKERGGAVFFLISGISAVLGSRHLRRGLLVLICAGVVTLATVLWGDPVRFGTLHCLGASMLCWEVFRRIDTPSLVTFGALFAALGPVLGSKTVEFPFLYPLGLTAPGFASADYFPLLPYLGFFLLGAAAGRRLYKERRSLLPKRSFSGYFSRFCRFCGRHALFLYLIHQPALIVLIEAFRRSFL